MRTKLIFCKDIMQCLWIGRKGSITPPAFSGWTDLLKFQRTDQSDTSIPRIIWLFWDAKVKPALVTATIERTKKLNPDCEVRLLDRSNAGEYVDANFLERADISLNHKSDILRLELLARYGGLWLDATCIYTEDFDWVFQAEREGPFDLIAFYRSAETNDFRYPVVESWFLACPPCNDSIMAWRDEFRKVVQCGSLGYSAGLSTRADYADLKQGISRPEYLAVYIAHQLVMRERPWSMYLRKCEDSAFLCQELVHWDRVKMAAMICLAPAPHPALPVLKLTYSNRYLLTALHRLRLVKTNSILGDFLSPLG